MTPVCGDFSTQSSPNRDNMSQENVFGAAHKYVRIKFVACGGCVELFRGAFDLG